MPVQPRPWRRQALQWAEGQGGGGDLFLFVESEMMRVLRRWKRTQVSKLLDKDGQHHQSCHLIYKQQRNRYDVRGGSLRDYRGGAPARTSAATQSECPRDEAIVTGESPFLHARASVHTQTQACPAPATATIPPQDHTPQSTPQHELPQPQPSILIQTTHVSHCSTSAFARMRASTHET
jgi:hypothetical protein